MNYHDSPTDPERRRSREQLEPLGGWESLPPPPARWGNVDRAVMFARLISLFAVAGFAAAAVWFGQQQQWPTSVCAAALAVLIAAEMYLPRGQLYRFRAHRPPAARSPRGKG